MIDCFNENQPVSPLLTGLLLGLAAIELVVAGMTRGSGLALLLTQGGTALLMLLLAYSFRSLKIRVTEDEIRFGFGPFKKKLLLSNVHSARIVDVSVLSAGIGIHMVRGKLWAWVARTGPAVEIILKEKTPGTNGYIVSTSQPRNLLDAVLGSAQAK